jgi:formylglycine-generating enzyme required for sulfatase activity
VIAACLLLAPCRALAEKVRLRSTPHNLTDQDIDRLIARHQFFDARRNPGGNVANRFEPARYGTDELVFDGATGLVWQQSGSESYMGWEEAKAHIRELNERRFAGYDRWRLPTVAELASLLEPEKRNGGLHIDPAFDSHQGWCWSSDQRGEGFAYLVSFYHGRIDWKFTCGRVFVRAVASSSRFRAGRRQPVVSRLESPGGKTYTNSIGMEFVRIPAGSFRMGSPESEPGRSEDEGPRHPVTLTRPFCLGVTEVTQGQWREIMQTNPSRFRGTDLPVEDVSWHDCREFIRRLNAREQTGSYRLPTEAEWEYACRAGSDSRFCFGDDMGEAAKQEPLRFYFGDEAGELENYAWYGNVSGNRTHPVARKKPNAWGLFDMHGNVAEWCSDRCGPYPAAARIDPQGPPTGSLRVLRGGGYGFDSWSVRSARRDCRPPRKHSCQWGFRVVLEVE